MELLAQAAGVVIPPNGRWLDSLVGNVQGTTELWLANATVVAFGLFWFFMISATVFRIAIVGAEARSIDAMIWRLPQILRQMILPLVVIQIAVALTGHALAIGTGLGSSVTGIAITGPSGLFGRFVALIVSVLIIPSKVMSTQAFNIFGMTQGGTAAGVTLICVLLIISFVFALAILTAGVLCTFSLIRAQIDCLIISPFLLIICAFASVSGDNLWGNAYSTFLRAVFRMALAIGISSLALVLLDNIRATIDSLGTVTDLYQLNFELFQLVGLTMIVAGLVWRLPHSLDAAFSGAGLAWGGPSPSVLATRAIAAMKRAA